MSLNEFIDEILSFHGMMEKVDRSKGYYPSALGARHHFVLSDSRGKPLITFDITYKQVGEERVPHVAQGDVNGNPFIYPPTQSTEDFLSNRKTGGSDDECTFNER